MGFFNLFPGKSPRDCEQKGDLYFQAGRPGRAKIEYEKALNKLGKASPEKPEDLKRLEEKILNSREKLARDHNKTAEDMLEAEYYEDALQYINLALELTSDTQFSEELETRARELKKTINRGIQQEFAEFRVFDDDTEDGDEDEERYIFKNYFRLSLFIHYVEERFSWNFSFYKKLLN